MSSTSYRELHWWCKLPTSFPQGFYSHKLHIHNCPWKRNLIGYDLASSAFTKPQNTSRGLDSTSCLTPYCGRLCFFWKDFASGQSHAKAKQKHEDAPAQLLNSSRKGMENSRVPRGTQSFAFSIFNQPFWSTESIGIETTYRKRPPVVEKDVANVTLR